MHNLARLFGRSAMVVKSVQIDESKECQVRVIARKAGLISWVLSLLGIDSTFTLSVYADRIESQEGSLSGCLKTVIPLSALDTYTNGFTKPVQWLAGAAVMMLFAWFIGLNRTGGLAIMVMAVIFLIAYFIEKCLVLSFTTNGANGIYFLFKRSIIEGVNVDESLADRITDIVKRNYLAQTRR